jgi:hypothetical protein
MATLADPLEVGGLSMNEGTVRIIGLFYAAQPTRTEAPVFEHIQMASIQAQFASANMLKVML